jgi:hypothetical protein
MESTKEKKVAVKNKTATQQQPVISKSREKSPIAGDVDCGPSPANIKSSNKGQGPAGENL